MPLLNSIIMGDDGQHKLELKVDELTNLIRKHPETTMQMAPDSGKELL